MFHIARPRTRLWSVSVAGHCDHLVFLVELYVVLPGRALGVIDCKVAAARGFLFHLTARAAEDFQGSLLIFSASAGVTGGSASAKVLLASAAANAIKKGFIVRSPIEHMKPAQAKFQRPKGVEPGGPADD